MFERKIFRSGFAAMMIVVLAMGTTAIAADYAPVLVFGTTQVTALDPLFSGSRPIVIGNGKLNIPSRIAIDSSGYIYVADTGNNLIQIFNSTGLYQYQSDGKSGSGSGQFNKPQGIAIDNNLVNLWVADTGNNRIQKFNSTGQIQFGSYGTGNGQFNDPRGLAVDSLGNIYVADNLNNRIQKFDSNGVFISTFGTQGTGDGQFNQPPDIAVDSSDNIYVADAGNNRIQKFDSNGVFISKFGTQGAGDGQLYYPNGVAVDKAGNVYVSDSKNNRIQKFNSAGVYQSQFGTQGSGDGQFNGPLGVAVDSSGNVYVVDTGNNRIQKWSPTGTTSVSKLTVTDITNPINIGTASNVTVTAQDANGNTVTSYTGTIHFTATDTGATLPTDYTFTAADNGTHTFTGGVKFATTGNQTVTATDAATSAIIGNQVVTVTTTSLITYTSLHGSDLGDMQPFSLQQTNFSTNFRVLIPPGTISFTLNALCYNISVVTAVAKFGQSPSGYTLPSSDSATKTLDQARTGNIISNNQEGLIFIVFQNFPQPLAENQAGWLYVDIVGSGVLRVDLDIFVNTSVYAPWYQKHKNIDIDCACAAQGNCNNGLCYDPGGTAPATYAVSFQAGSGGSISGSASQTVNQGSSTTAVTAMPNTGYQFVNWTGTGGFITTSANPLTISNVTANMTVTANFQPIAVTQPNILDISCLKTQNGYYKTTLQKYDPSDAEKKEQNYSDSQGVYFWEMTDWNMADAATQCGTWNNNTFSFTFPGQGSFDFHRDAGSDDFFGFYWKQSGVLSPSVSIPAAPADVQATAGDGQAVISWNAVTGADSYVVSYKTAGFTWTSAGETKDTSMTVGSLTNGTAYSFAVQAKNSAGTSGYSGEAAATPKAPATPIDPTQPAGDKITVNSDGTVVNNTGAAIQVSKWEYVEQGYFSSSLWSPTWGGTPQSWVARLNSDIPSGSNWVYSYSGNDLIATWTYNFEIPADSSSDYFKAIKQDLDQINQTYYQQYGVKLYYKVYTNVGTFIIQ